jgi:hypothetical protein
MFNGASNREGMSRFDAKFSVHGDAKSNAAFIIVEQVNQSAI